MKGIPMDTGWPAGEFLDATHSFPGEGRAASCVKLGLCVSYQPNHSEKGRTVVNRWYEF